MRAEGCRDWRATLGAYALGDLSADERAGLEAHLEGCAGCRAELTSLQPVARLLALADPARFSQPAPRPPADLGERVTATIGAEREARTAKRRQRRVGVALAGATAAAVAVLAIVIFSGGNGDNGVPTQHVEFAGLPAGVEVNAALEPHAYGTEIHMYVKGARSGVLCRVFLRDRRGRVFPAGSFRYRWGDDSDAVLSSALDLSRTRSIGVHAGNRTYVAPVDQGATATTQKLNEEDA